MEQSTFCVVKIINEYSIAIDGGNQKDIKEGQQFIIYSLTDEDIIHPVTNENLGKLEIVKGIGKVVSVQPKMAILDSNKFEKSSSRRRIIRKNNSMSAYLYGQFKPGEEIEEEINAPEQLPFEDVKVGDFVRRA
jgi:hypothetical protein